jgi:hypothetical protein
VPGERCPLKEIGTRDVRYCTKKECSFWDDDGDQCVFISTKHALDMIGGYLWKTLDEPKKVLKPSRKLQSDQEG